MTEGESDYLRADFVSNLLSRPESRDVDDLTQQLTTICKRRLGVVHVLARQLAKDVSKDGDETGDYGIPITTELLAALTKVRRTRDQDLSRLGCGLRAGEIINRWDTIREGNTRFHYGTQS